MKILYLKCNDLILIAQYMRKECHLETRSKENVQNKVQRNKGKEKQRKLPGHSQEIQENVQTDVQLKSHKKRKEKKQKNG